jgi:hypothetical protein
MKIILDKYYFTRYQRARATNQAAILDTNDIQRITRIYKYVVLINDSPALFAKVIDNARNKNDELSVSKHFGRDQSASTTNINENDSKGGYKYRKFNNIRVRNAASWMMDAMETSDDIRGTYERLLVTVVIYI